MNIDRMYDELYGEITKKEERSIGDSDSRALPIQNSDISLSSSQKVDNPQNKTSELNDHPTQVQKDEVSQYKEESIIKDTKDSNVDELVRYQLNILLGEDIHVNDEDDEDDDDKDVNRSLLLDQLLDEDESEELSDKPKSPKERSNGTESNQSNDAMITETTLQDESMIVEDSKVSAGCPVSQPSSKQSLKVKNEPSPIIFPKGNKGYGIIDILDSDDDSSSPIDSFVLSIINSDKQESDHQSKRSIPQSEEVRSLTQPEEVKSLPQPEVVRSSPQTKEVKSSTQSSQVTTETLSNIHSSTDSLLQSRVSIKRDHDTEVDPFDQKDSKVTAVLKAVDNMKDSISFDDDSLGSD